MAEAAVAMFLALGACGAARAQTNPFDFTSDRGLTNADYALLIDAGTRLLQQPNLTNGTSTQWHNPKTGASGRVVVEATTSHDDQPCHRLVYRTSVGGASSASSTQLLWCKVNGTGWRIIPD